jgi:hypothetical protein
MHTPQGTLVAVEADAALRHLRVESVGAELIHAEDSRKKPADIFLAIEINEEGASEFGFGKDHFKMIRRMKVEPERFAE